MIQKLLVYVYRACFRILYPDINSRGVAYAAEAGEALSIAHFQKGEVLTQVVIESDGSNGYYVGVNIKEEVAK